MKIIHQLLLKFRTLGMKIYRILLEDILYKGVF